MTIQYFSAGGANLYIYIYIYISFLILPFIRLPCYPRNAYFCSDTSKYFIQNPLLSELCIFTPQYVYLHIGQIPSSLFLLTPFNLQNLILFSPYQVVYPNVAKRFHVDEARISYSLIDRDRLHLRSRQSS
jgi:hypothetical protein